MFDVIPINGQTWLVCGGRDFDDPQMFDSAMADLVRLRGCPIKVVHGGARGADTMAGNWAVTKALHWAVEKANWETDGFAAGPIRNQRMLDIHKPDFVIAFPGGRGTADMVRRARKADIDVAEVKPAVRTDD